EISVTTNGSKTTIKAGNPTIKRLGVANYTIREIIVAPDGKTGVVLIEKLEKNEHGSTIRYMVETYRLP
ncbi:MAG: hypothetical protein JXM71_10425, partial [Spirochaetales bacterium]|nr:hypothetical protein [Spirochaetales bacterium]